MSNIPDDDIEKAASLIREYGDGLAEWRGKRIFREEMRKAVKADEMHKADEFHKIHNDKPLSVGMQERDAYRSAAFKKAVEAWAEAEEREYYFKSRLLAVEKMVEIWRTKSSNERQEKKVYNG